MKRCDDLDVSTDAAMMDLLSMLILSALVEVHASVLAWPNTFVLAAYRQQTASQESRRRL